MLEMFEGAISFDRAFIKNWDSIKTQERVEICIAVYAVTEQGYLDYFGPGGDRLLLSAGTTAVHKNRRLG